MKPLPQLRSAALSAAATIAIHLICGPTGSAQVNSTNIAGTGTLLPTANFAAIISGKSSSNGGTNSAIIGAANSIVPGGTRFAFIGAGNFNNMAAGSHSAAMIGGFSNTIATGAARGVTLGGGFNTNAGRSAVILGGELNQIGINSTGAAIIGGLGNIVGTDATAASIGGGSGNRTLGKFTGVSSGQGNAVEFLSTGSFIGGGISNTVTATEFILVDSNDIIIATNPAVATIAGGGSNTVTAAGGFIGGGAFNTNGGFLAVIGGGDGNTVNAYDINTEAGGDYSAIGGGTANTVTDAFAAIGGGNGNRAGFYGIVPGGYQNEAGDDSFAAGNFAKATNTGSFVWSGFYDELATPTVSTNDYSFTVRAPGGVRFITTQATNNLEILGAIGTNGVAVAPGGTAWLTLSDSNAKTAVKQVDPREVLTKLSRMPVTEWEYKHDPHRRYFGPMSQDFHAAFGLGRDEKTINTLDADGVLFLSVQGLVEELKERDKAIEELKRKSAEVDELKSELRALREQMQSLLPPAP